jgi:hypothetical protein
VKPTRALPTVGASVAIWHFGGESEPATIVELRDGGRTLVVADAGGHRREFTLRRATAAFVARGEQHSPRLEF